MLCLFTGSDELAFVALFCLQLKVGFPFVSLAAVACLLVGENSNRFKFKSRMYSRVREQFL